MKEAILNHRLKMPRVVAKPAFLEAVAQRAVRQRLTAIERGRRDAMRALLDTVPSASITRQHDLRRLREYPTIANQQVSVLKCV